jgi:Tfp pilus assembly protein PilO
MKNIKLKHILYIILGLAAVFAFDYFLLRNTIKDDAHNHEHEQEEAKAEFFHKKGVFLSTAKVYRHLGHCVKPKMICVKKS